MSRTFAALLAAFFVLFGAASAQQAQPSLPTHLPIAQGERALGLFPSLIEHSRHRATLQDGRLTGEGAELLKALGRDAHFVMIGEEHGNAGIANFAAAYWRDLNDAGFNYLALEIDPYVASAALREMRSGGVEQWRNFLQSHGGASGAAFLTWAPEAAYADLAVRTSRARRQPALWGLDQVYGGSAPWLLEDISRHARSAEARALAAQIVQSEQSPRDAGWLGRLDGAGLQTLRAALSHRADKEWSDAVDDMIVSHRIYQPFTTGNGEAYYANAEREALMRRAFQDHYEAAARVDSETPRVMIKLGSNHVMRGATASWVQGFGGFVTEYAAAHDLGAITVLAVCGPGGHTPSRTSDGACQPGFDERFPFLAPYVDAQALTIFDLREWRMRPQYWSNLPASAQMTIGSYDALVVVPNAPASAALDGLADVAASLSIDSTLGELLNNPSARQVLQRHAPELLANPQIGQASGVSLRLLAPHVGNILTAARLEAINNDLMRLQH